MTALSHPDFEALFDAAPGIFLVLDSDFVMIAANEARLKATMTTRAEVIGRNLFEVFPDNPDDPAADGVRNLRASLERVLATRAPDTMAVQKYDIPRPAEQGGGFEVRYWSPLNSPVLGADGEVKYIIHRVEDVTDFILLKQHEAHLQSHAERVEQEVYQRAQEVQEANRKLEAANAELRRLSDETQEMASTQQRFFSQVSHELRTPLTLILGPAETLAAQPERLAPDQRRELHSIARNGRTLLRHVNDLLDVVKYRSASDLKPAYARGDLAERVRVAAAHFDSASMDRTLSVEIDAPETLEAEFDPEKIDRVLLNLLSNAYKFTPDGGAIRCGLRRAGDDAILSVADTGPGVPPDLREAIFEPFRQGDEGLTRRASGTGLGLAIVREFVALHLGQIRVLDSDGGGALFEIRMPLRAPAGVKVEASPARALEDWNFQQAIEARQSESDAPVEARGRGDAARILVVDDNRDMAAFIARTLASTYEITIARNGKEGLQLAEELTPDLVVSDLMMPEMSGDQLVAAMSHRPKTRDIPVLLLTARADEETRVGALRQGVGDFLAKPFSTEELRARVDNLVRSKRAGDLVKRGKKISDERYAKLMDGARDAVFILNPDGLILDANRQAAVMASAQPALLIGVRLEEALDLAPASSTALRNAEGVVALESRSREGVQPRSFEASAAGVVIDGEAFRLVIVRDVTEQRLIEAQLRHAQKLDALGQLTGGIAHDFNNLLTVVAANAEALMVRLNDRPEAAGLAANIERAAENGSAMTRRLLAFARRQEIETRVCDINAVVGSAVEMLKRTLASNIAIETQLGADLPPVLIDPSQLEDALLNLAINARDAMPGGGRLSIETSAPTEGASVCVRVADTGEGMSAETMQRVFEPFFTTKGEGKGTGLGLSMVYGFARQAGGDVRIESTPGQGTSVSIVLPAHAAGVRVDQRSSAGG